MKVFRGAAFVIGTVVGAGFISGAELIRFFPNEKGVGSILFSIVLFFAMALFFCLMGKKYGGFQKAIKALFKRGACVVFACSYLSLFVCVAVMLAGLDSLFPQIAPLSSVVGATLVLLFLRRGIRGVEVFHAILVPIILCCIFFGKGSLAFSYPAKDCASGIGGAFLYAGLNLFLALPVFMEWGAKGGSWKELAIGCTVISCCAVVILGKIYHEGANAIQAEMPLLYVMRESPAFYVVSLFAVLTSLASALFPLLNSCAKGGRIKNYAAKSGLLLTAFALSRFGLQSIVNHVYPILGLCGLAVSAFAIFNEYFFQHRNEKIHHSG